MDTDKKLQDAQKRLSDAIAAESFGESDAGALMLEYINDRVSSLINKMIGATPIVTGKQIGRAHV